MDQTRLPLYEKIIIHQSANPISFHVPGHKSGLLYENLDAVYSQFNGFDVTELPGLDDLHDPQAEIAEAQQLLAELYNTKKSYFLVNGSTVGNLSMILATCHEGDSVIVQRNCHKSILNGLMLANVNPIFISPKWNEQMGIPTGIDLDIFRKAIEQYPSAKACIFTFPDYYGQTFQLQQIIDEAHENKMIVMIDEAHGAHFQLGDPFPPSSLTLGADIVVQSAHKTLPAMTMGSYLHINSTRISEKKVNSYLTILQSSSPSYPIMASLDYARYYLAHYNKEDVIYTLQLRDAFIKELQMIPMLSIVKVHDPIKLLVRHKWLSGYQLQALLESVGIFPELADPYQVLLILPLLKRNMTYPYNLAIEKVKQISWGVKDDLQIPMHRSDKSEMEITKLVFSYQEMIDMPIEWVTMENTEDKIAAQAIIPYPPGIPLILQGERITHGHITRLKELIRTGARFQGDAEKIIAGSIAVFS